MTNTADLAKGNLKLRTRGIEGIYYKDLARVRSDGQGQGDKNKRIG